MQPIATPDRTIDSTIGSGGAVAGCKVEGAFLERVRLDHYDLPIGVAVMLVRRERDVAVDAAEVLQLVPVGDDLLRLAAGILDRLGDEPRPIVAERDPPQQRIAHVDLRRAQTADEVLGTVWEIALRVVANRAEIVRIHLRPVFRFLEPCLGLAGTERWRA